VSVRINIFPVIRVRSRLNQQKLAHWERIINYNPPSKGGAAKDGRGDSCKDTDKASLNDKKMEKQNICLLTLSASKYRHGGTRHDGGFPLNVDRV